jgi:hypothetical protein
MTDTHMENSVVNDRRQLFFSQLNLSESVARNYRNALNSTFLKVTLAEKSNKESLFEITDLEELWNLYSFINLHPRNVANHRVYSAAVMKYIRFLNDGKKYGRRIDYNKTKPKKK